MKNTNFHQPRSNTIAFTITGETTEPEIIAGFLHVMNKHPQCKLAMFHQTFDDLDEEVENDFFDPDDNQPRFDA